MVLRRRRRAGVDPLAEIDSGALPHAYRGPVEDAVRVRRQFAELVGGRAPGPLRDRLVELSARVDAGVLAVWGSAREAVQLEQVLSTLDPERVMDDLKRARRDGADPMVLDSLSARFASVQRLLNALDAVRQRLPVLEARLGTAVARAAELTLVSPAAVAAAELDGLAGELDRLTEELHALAEASYELG